MFKGVAEIPRWHQPVRTIPSLIAMLLFSLLGTGLHADPPELKALVPAGGAVGATTTVQAVGKFPQWPVEGICNAAGIEVRADAEKQGQLEITIGQDVLPGSYWIRLVDEQGATRARRFVVSAALEINESETGPTEIDLTGPCVVNGRLTKNNEVDVFRMSLAAGATLIADLDAHGALGSPMDAVLQIASVEQGNVLLQNDDTRGLDPRLVFRAPSDGVYAIRLFAFPETPNSRIGFAGGDDFVYRLQLTTDAFVDHGFPLAVNSQALESVRAEGVGAIDPQRVVRRALEGLGHRCASIYQPDALGVGHVEIVETAALAEDEDASRQRPLHGSLPVVISGRIDAGDPEDAFRLTAEPSRRIRVSVEAHQLGFPLDPVLTVYDMQGKQLVRVDDERNSRDGSVELQVPEDGQFELVVTDLHRSGSREHLYRINAQSIEPTFELTVEAETFAAQVGDELTVPVKVIRRDGFDGQIEVGILGMPEGVSATGATSVAKTETDAAVTLILKADKPAQGYFRVVGTSVGDRSLIPALAPSTVPPATHERLFVVIRARD